MELIAIIIVGALFLALFGFFTVSQQQVALIERFGKFIRQSEAGLRWRIPFIDQIRGRVSLRVQELNVQVETKTKDSVFVNLNIAVQYYVLPEKIYDAFYRLVNPQEQIKSFVFDVVRARVPGISVDEVFEKKDEIAIAVKKELEAIMDDFGYGILNALVTDIDPDAKVKAAMNEINASQRMKIVAEARGEADRIMKVKSAEAEAESKALQGKGIADQRMAIIDGLRSSVDEFQKSIPGATAQDVMNLVMITQYFDTLKDIGQTSNASTIMIPHSPGAITDLTEQIRTAMITAQEVSKNHKTK